MKKICENLFIGSLDDCVEGDSNLSVVHACKTPCHQNKIGYTGNLPKNHGHYLYFRDEYNLYLNIIDPPIPLFQKKTFDIFFEFMAMKASFGDNVLIHCNQGKSRAPSLGLLFMARVFWDSLRGNSYAESRKDFEKIYPEYNPGKGIETYLTENWEKLIQSPPIYL